MNKHTNTSLDTLVQFLMRHGKNASSVAKEHEAIENQLITLIEKGGSATIGALAKRIQSNAEAVYGFERVITDLSDAGKIDFGNHLGESEAIFERVADTRDELIKFLEGMSRPFDTFVVVLNHGSEFTVEVGWMDYIRGGTIRVVWDRWIETSGDPVILFAGICFLFDSNEYRCAAKPTEKPEPPMYRYHPERFKAYRNYAEQVGKLYRQQVNPESGMMTVEQMNQAANIVIPEVNERNMNYPRKLSEGLPHPSLVIDSELSLATAYGRFVQAGRQIMDFPPALTEMLAETDIDDMRLDNIKMPYASQYLYFGQQPTIEIEPGWFVDGAYVESRGHAGDIRFTITAVPSDHSKSEMWNRLPEPHYTQDFVEKFRTMDIATAIDIVLSEKLAELNKRSAMAGGDITEQTRKTFEQHGESFPEDVSLVDVSPTLAKKRIEIASQRHPSYLAALRLTVNALCYVTAYSDDIAAVWPEGTPETLKQKALFGKGKEVMRAKSKLASLGYVPVHICGQRIVEQRQIAHMNGVASGGRAVHWRRGHWRNQVHGTGRALRKLIWVMPTIVGAGDNEQPLGHLYLVS